MERERISKAVRQSQQRSIDEMWNISPFRLAFVVHSIYDVLPLRDNLQRWKITQDDKCTLLEKDRLSDMFCLAAVMHLLTADLLGPTTSILFVDLDVTSLISESVRGFKGAKKGSPL